jgi:AraC family transcriptional regulator
MPVLEKLIWNIETNLDSHLSLKLLAERCAVSTHHVCRVFQLATGMSVMSYVRARRLSRAAEALAESRADILTVALDASYGSHEAFTRAFANYFGTAPSNLRKTTASVSLSLMEPIEMKKDMIVPVAAPEMRDRHAFRVVGLGIDCADDNIGGIPALWQQFNLREDEVASAVSGKAYGVCHAADEAGNFRYLAGVEASEKTPGMEHVDLPAQRYAVFTHDGHISALPKTVYTVWNKVLPDMGLQPAMTPDFELYDHRFNPQTGEGTVEIWIPVA